MIIGVGKEIKTDERRVALLPEQVPLFTSKGHKVLVEKGAGERACFPDEAYISKGAEIVSKEELYQRASLIYKVKCPLPEEYKFLRKDQILFTYLHFDENIPPEKIYQIAETGVIGIAYEWVEVDGTYPLLRPMSELTGNLFALMSMDLLMKHKGKLPGGYQENLDPPKAMIIGIGHIGANALKVFLMNNLKVYVVDKHPETLRDRILKYVWQELWDATHENINVIPFDNQNPQNTLKKIEALMPHLDILINSAVRRPDLPKSKLEYLITRDMVSKMEPLSVVCDATACDKDFIETAISSEELFKTYIDENVVHYNCDHIPSLVPNSASILLSKETVPYAQILADKGFERAVKEHPPLFKAVMCYKGKITHKYSCEKKNMPFTPLESLL